MFTVKTEVVGKNAWNTQCKLIFDASVVNSFCEFLTYRKSIPQNKRNGIIKLPALVEEELTLAYEQGYGLKILARSFNTSYSIMRRVLKYISDIDVKEGHNICNEVTKKLRKERVSVDNPWKHDEIQKKNKSGKGIQGYFINANGDKLWLRSTYEYIYIKWLDKKRINYKYEERQYKLSNGESYRPDFHIYDENGKLSHIVEVKGFFNDRTYKTAILEKEYGIRVVLVNDVTNYCENYHKELAEWKQKKLKK